VKRQLFIVEVVDHHARIQFAEDETLIVRILPAAGWMGLLLLGWRHRFR
jgi:inorganic pyrophosphatase/exopolyphosphatase